MLRETLQGGVAGVPEVMRESSVHSVSVNLASSDRVEYIEIKTDLRTPVKVSKLLGTLGFGMSSRSKFELESVRYWIYEP